MLLDLGCIEGVSTLLIRSSTRNLVQVVLLEPGVEVTFAPAETATLLTRAQDVAQAMAGKAFEKSFDILYGYRLILRKKASSGHRYRVMEFCSILDPRPRICPESWRIK